MKKSKRLLALLLAGVMVSSFAACGDKDTDKDKDTSGDKTSSSDDKNKDDDVTMDGDIELNEPGEFPIVKEGQEPVHLSITTSPQLDTNDNFDRDVNEYTPWLEDKLNLRFDWTVISKADKQAKMNLLFTTDDYSDIVFNSGWDAEGFAAYGDAGYIIPIDPYYDREEDVFRQKYLAEAKKIGDPGASDLVLSTEVMPDGHIYSFYNYSTCVHTMASYRMWCYTPWLEKVGMEVPTTTDEFYDVLKAFKEKDPNGNGKADEIPLTGSLKGWNMDPTMYLMNSFLYYTGPVRRNIYNDDGTIVYAPTQDAFKDGIDYMHKLTEDELLLTDTWTQDNNAAKSLTTQDVNLVGFMPGGAMSAITMVTNRSEGDWTNWKAIDPLKGPDGVQYSLYTPPFPPGLFQITDNCEYPRIAFRFGDAMYDLEIARNAKQGLQGEFWEYAKEGDKGLDGEPAKVTILATLSGGETTKSNTAWSQMCHTPDFPGWHTGMTVVGDPELDTEALLYKYGKSYLEYAPDDSMPVPTLIFEEKDSADVIDWKTATDTYVTETMTNFIINGCSDKEWETYKKELNARGLDGLMKIYQETFDRLYA